MSYLNLVISHLLLISMLLRLLLLMLASLLICWMLNSENALKMILLNCLSFSMMILIERRRSVLGWLQIRSQLITLVANYLAQQLLEHLQELTAPNKPNS